VPLDSEDLTAWSSFEGIGGGLLLVAFNLPLFIERTRQDAAVGESVVHAKRNAGARSFCFRVSRCGDW
jgi:hypothetical protein